MPEITLGENIAGHLAWFRAWAGTSVTYNAVDYDAITRPATGSDVGTMALSVEQFRVFLASADPRLFKINARLFKDYTALTPPQEGGILVWHNLNYLITCVKYGDLHADTHSLYLFAYRYIDQATG